MCVGLGHSKENKPILSAGLPNTRNPGISLIALRHTLLIVVHVAQLCRNQFVANNL